MPKNKKLTQLQKKLEEWSPGASKIIDLKKLKKANELGIPVLSEQEFLAMLGEEAENNETPDAVKENDGGQMSFL